MINVKIDAATLRLARKYAKEMGVLWGSVTRGAGNVAGMLGELLYEKHCNWEHVRPYKVSHDLTFGELKIDVKTKQCAGEPLPEYYASVMSATGKKPADTDIYAFARVTRDFKEGWLLGWITVDEFYEKAIFIEKGTREGAFLYRADGYHMPISSLNPLETLCSPSVRKASRRLSKTKAKTRR